MLPLPQLQPTLGRWFSLFVAGVHGIPFSAGSEQQHTTESPPSRHDTPVEKDPVVSTRSMDLPESPPSPTSSFSDGPADTPEDIAHATAHPPDPHLDVGDNWFSVPTRPGLAPGESVVLMQTVPVGSDPGWYYAVQFRLRGNTKGAFLTWDDRFLDSPPDPMTFAPPPRQEVLGGVAHWIWTGGQTVSLPDHSVWSAIPFP